VSPFFSLWSLLYSFSFSLTLFSLYRSLPLFQLLSLRPSAAHSAGFIFFNSSFRSCVLHPCPFRRSVSTILFLHSSMFPSASLIHFLSHIFPCIIHSSCFTHLNSVFLNSAFISLWLFHISNSPFQIVSISSRSSSTPGSVLPHSNL
jgi:hypothetical protein